MAYGRRASTRTALWLMGALGCGAVGGGVQSWLPGPFVGPIMSACGVGALVCGVMFVKGYWRD